MTHNHRALDSASDQHEESLFLQPAARRRAGRFYTPAHTADLLLASLPALPRHGLVIDPACGTGNLLLAARRALLPNPAALPEPTRIAFARRLRGADTDPHAISLARQRLLADLHLLPNHPSLLDDLLTSADGLTAEPAPPMDSASPLVLLNPPFGNAIRQETRRDEHEAATLREHFPHAAHGAFDRAWLFVERALQLAGPSGTLALILPAAFAAAPSAHALRQHIARTHAVAHIAPLPPDTFRATQVRTLMAVLGPVDTGGQPDAWAMGLRDDPGLLISPPDDWPHLGELLALEACAAADEAYRLKPHVHEAQGGETPGEAPEETSGDKAGAESAGISSVQSGVQSDHIGGLMNARSGARSGEQSDDRNGGKPERGLPALRLVTTGCIEPGHLLWGERPQRYLGLRLTRPVIHAATFSPGRRALHRAPKLLVAGLSRVLEVAVDREGSVAGAVAVIAGRAACAGVLGTAVEPANVPDGVGLLLRLEAWLNGSVARLWYRQRHGAKAMGGGSIAVGKRPLGGVPVAPGLLGRAGGEPAGVWEALAEEERERWRGWWKDTPDSAGWRAAVRGLEAVDATAAGVLAELDRTAAIAAADVPAARERRAQLDALTAWLALDGGIGWDGRA